MKQWLQNYNLKRYCDCKTWNTNLHRIKNCFYSDYSSTSKGCI